MDDQNTAVQEITAANILTAATAAAELLRIRQGQGLTLTEDEALDVRHQAALIKRYATEMAPE